MFVVLFFGGKENVGGWGDNGGSNDGEMGGGLEMIFKV